MESALQTLPSQTHEQAAIHEALACLDRFAETIRTHLDQADSDARREILRTLIDGIVVDTDQVRIVYRITFPLLLKTRNNYNFSQRCWRPNATVSGARRDALPQCLL